MNSHTTPRPFAGRSIGLGPIQQQQQYQNQQPSQQQQQQQQRPPLAPQVSTNEEYASIADEDREHIDEVVRACPFPSLFPSLFPPFSKRYLFLLSLWNGCLVAFDWGKEY